MQVGHSTKRFMVNKLVIEILKGNQGFPILDSNHNSFISEAKSPKLVINKINITLKSTNNCKFITNRFNRLKKFCNKLVTTSHLTKFIFKMNDPGVGLISIKSSSMSPSLTASGGSRNKRN